MGQFARRFQQAQLSWRRLDWCRDEANVLICGMPGVDAMLAGGQH
ncbi:hypothetical protein [Mycobacterium talmoniae]|nr:MULTISPECIES: hypothetical protein [Mycobacterium]